MRLPDSRPALMGILNVTPDSFSDGGSYSSVEEAIDAAMRMYAEGADLIDVGGESTRPGAEPVPLDEELRRVVPVVEALKAERIAVSVDTMKAEVARRAIEAGVEVINDVTALRDPEMREACAVATCDVCLMHMKGEPRTMQRSPEYPQGVVPEVSAFLAEAARRAGMAGISTERIWLDPGIGFGKTTEHNLELLANLDRLVLLGYPLVVGVSRKAFVGRVGRSEIDPLPVTDRLEGTLAAQVLAQAAGARVIRAHDVRAARRAIDMASAVLRMTPESSPPFSERSPWGN